MKTPPPVEDKLLDELEKFVLDVLHDPNANARLKAQVAAHGVRLLMVRHRVKGPPEGENFFG